MIVCRRIETMGKLFGGQRIRCKTEQVKTEKQKKKKKVIKKKKPEQGKEEHSFRKKYPHRCAKQETTKSLTQRDLSLT